MGINMAHREVVKVTAEDMARARNNDQASNWKEKTMNATFIKLSAVAIAFSMSVAIPAAYSEEKGKGKEKGKQNVDAKEKHGREAGELPHGLEQFSEKKGNLPSGLQKKKDENESLPRGLEQGGKKLTSTSKGKRSSK
jgi:hypothetical protein